VAWIENYRPFNRTNAYATGIMGGPVAATQGLHGENVKVAVADTGLDKGSKTDVILDFKGRIDNIKSYPVATNPCFSNSGANDGASDKQSGYGTHVAGSFVGDGALSGGAEH